MNNSPSGNSYKFPSEEKLKLKKQIEKLFQSGKAFSFQQIRVIYTFAPPSDAFKIKFGVSVPKKKFKRAHDRNKVKRLIREAWRLQQQLIKAQLPNNVQLHCFIVYQNSKIESFEHIKATIAHLMDKLCHVIPEQVVENTIEH